MKQKLEDYIELAFKQLYENDKHLICNIPANYSEHDKKHHVGERSIVFRFAYYLQNLICEDGILKDFDLDCEYNRNGSETKKLPSFPRGTYPDLIIHKRGRNDANLLVMEFKTYWNSNQIIDIQKIREFTDPDGQYRFKYGVAVLIGKDKEIKQWFDEKCYVN